ncbi:hypothetical protein ACS0TY_025499 [Phlomoides rotata]
MNFNTTLKIMMKNHQLAAFLLACACIFPEIMLSAAETTDKFCPMGRFTLHVVAVVPGRLKVHCRSKDDDLGDHFLKEFDDYNFNFCNHISGRTLFTCNIWWGNKQVGFQAFTNKSRFHICIRGDCTWEARYDGIYVSDKDSGGYIKKYDW